MPTVYEISKLRAARAAALVVLASGLSLMPASAAPPAGYYLVWGDEFNGPSLDMTKWDYWVDNRVWGKAYNDGAEAVSVSGGHLVITTKTINGTNYTAIVASDNHFRPRYGYYEASIQWGDYSGMWSAFWLRSPVLGTYLYDPLDDGGELDVCEHRQIGIYGTNIANIVSDNIHWNGYGSQEQSTGSPNVGSGLATDFHTYSLLWTNDSYDFGIDGSTVWHTGSDGSPPTPQFGSGAYIILSSQVDDGADVGSPPWAGYIPSGGYTTGTNQLVVDYFHYYAPTNVLFWTGGASAYWTNIANWVSNLPPLATSDLTFSYLSQNLSNILGSEYAVHGLIFLNMTASPSINGSNTLALGSGGIDTLSADHNVTLNAPINLTASQSWTLGRNNPGDLLIVNGSLSGSAILTKTGYGTLILNGTNSFSGVLNVDSGGTNNDGVVLLANSAAATNLSSVSIRNTNLGVSALQLSNSVALPCIVSLAGRNNSMVPIEALLGTSNAIAGGLTLAGGGSNYWLQADSGTFYIGGTVSAGGTATGNRTLTLQGIGSFSIYASIQNGSASTLNLLKTNSGSLTLSGANTYTGGTTNYRGTLFVDGSLAGPLTINSGYLSGTGSVAGATTIKAGSDLSPGTAIANSIGTLSFGNSLTLSAGSTTLLEINAISQTNDVLNVAGTLNCGGTLYVQNMSGTLAPGQSFHLFNAGSVAGSFSSLTLPPLPSGLVWNTNNLPNGILSVIAVSPPETLGVTNVGNGQLQLNWAYGLLQCATNVTGPYDTLSNVSSPYIVPTTNSQMFYRIQEE